MRRIIRLLAMLAPAALFAVPAFAQSARRRAALGVGRRRQDRPRRTRPRRRGRAHKTDFQTGELNLQLQARPDVALVEVRGIPRRRQGRQHAGVPSVRQRRRSPVRPARPERQAARRALHRLPQDRLLRRVGRLQLDRPPHRQRRPDDAGAAVAGGVADEPDAAADVPEHLGIDDQRQPRLHDVRGAAVHAVDSATATPSTCRCCASAPTSSWTSRATSRSRRR